ncbi:MAG TPA: site-2 protease family protein [Myxococcales bacterium]|nr:site-2 protease family protein [Myxococcales bacterium]
MHLFELRRDLEFTPLRRDGVELVVAHDPVTDSYIDLEPAQVEVLQLADGRTTVEEIRGALAEAGNDFTREEVRGFLAQASSRGLMTLSSLEGEVELDWSQARGVRKLAAEFSGKLEAHPANAPWRAAAEAASGQLRRERIVLGARALEEALALGGPPECGELLDQISAVYYGALGDPRLFKLGKLLKGDPIAAALERALRPLLTRWWLAGFATAAVIATALVMVQMNRVELKRSLDPVLTAVVLAISLALHELGHAVACRRVGGRVGNIGVGLIYYFLPIGYADVSGTYLVPDRWRRMLVGAAGILVNQTLVALAYPFMVLTAGGSAVHDVATAVVVMNAGTYIINSIPFIRLDGYYMLADLLGTPKLGHEGDMALASLAVPDLSSEKGVKLWVLRVYGAGALAFRLAFLLFGVHFIYAFLGGKVGRTAAFILAAILVKRMGSAFVLRPVRYLRRNPKALRMWRVQAALALVVGGLFAVPLPWTVAASGTVQRPRLPARAAAAGRLASLSVRDGDRVEKGQALGALENRELEARALAAEARVSAARAAQAALEHGERSQRLQAATAAVAAAQAKADAAAAGGARLEGLAAAGLAPERELERARTAQAQGGAELAMKQEALRLLAGADPLALREARAALDAALLEQAAVERLQQGLTLTSPAAGRVATPLEDAAGRWYAEGEAVLEVAAEERSEVSVVLPPEVPWEGLSRAEAWIPSAGRSLPLAVKQVRFPGAGAGAGAALVLESEIPPPPAALDGAQAAVRFHLGVRPLAYQYAVETARALRFELWMAELEPGFLAGN